MTERQGENLARSGHLTIYPAPSRGPRVIRLGLAKALVLTALIVGIVLGQVWAHAQADRRAYLAAQTPGI